MPIPTDAAIIAVFTPIAADARRTAPMGRMKVPIRMAGTYWPAKGRKLWQAEIEEKFTQTLKMVEEAYMVSRTTSNVANRALMTRWFGAPTANPVSTWTGVKNILKVISRQLVIGVKVYYRGNRTLAGRPSDLPADQGPPRLNIGVGNCTAIAEASSGAKDGRVCLCEDYFKQTKTTRVEHGKRRTFYDRVVKLTGLDSVTGTIIHELSHNMCDTDDHYDPRDLPPYGPDGQDQIYGSVDCIWLAANYGKLAWYNADNIEYFCEEIRDR